MEHPTKRNKKESKTVEPIKVKDHVHSRTKTEKVKDFITGTGLSTKAEKVRDFAMVGLIAASGAAGTLAQVLKKAPKIAKKAYAQGNRNNKRP